MSKKLGGNIPSGEPMSGYLVYDYQVGNLEGKLLTLIDGLGFQDKQGDAVKDMLRGIVRTSLYLETFYVEGKILNEARLKMEETYPKNPLLNRSIR